MCPSISNAEAMRSPPYLPIRTAWAHLSFQHRYCARKSLQNRFTQCRAVLARLWAT